MPEKLGGKTAIVTGAANGIGKAITKRFAEAGAKVYMVDIDIEMGAATADRLRARNLDVEFIETDVTDREAVFRMANQVKADAGAIDTLVNNAGRDVCVDPLAMTESEWRYCLAVNLESALYCCQAIIPFMIDRKCGSVINMASVQALRIIKGAFPYPVAKHALLGLTKALAIEYAEFGLRINSLSPGPIETELVRRNRQLLADPENARQDVESKIPSGRYGKPEEIAAAALFLASDDSSYVNAANLILDGGREVVYW